jgi:hypothetical protein
MALPVRGFKASLSRKLKKSPNFFEKVAQTVAKDENAQSVQLYGPNYRHQITFKTFQYIQQTMI